MSDLLQAAKQNKNSIIEFFMHAFTHSTYVYKYILVTTVVRLLNYSQAKMYLIANTKSFLYLLQLKIIIPQILKS